MDATEYVVDSSWHRSLPIKEQGRIANQRAIGIKSAQATYLIDLLHEVIHHAAGNYYYDDWTLTRAAANLGEISPEELAKIDPSNKDIKASHAWNEILKNYCKAPSLP